MVYSREQPSPRYAALLSQYQQLHRDGEQARGIPPEEKYKGISLPRHAGTIKELIDRYQARTILDYGSGKGKQYEEYAVKTGDGRMFPSIPAFWDIESVTCYDPAVPAFAHLPRGEFDGVVSTDVLEHVPEEDVDWIVTEMLGYARRFLFMNIASFAAKAHLPNGENAHCTIKSAEWWRRKLAALHSSRPQVHLLSQVVELVPGETKGKLHRIELLPASHSSTDVVSPKAVPDHFAKGETSGHTIALDLDPVLATQIEQAFARVTASSSRSNENRKPESTLSDASQGGRPQAAGLTSQGREAMLRGEYAAATHCLRQAAVLARGDVEARCNYGTSLLQAGRRVEAEQEFLACLAADAKHGRSKFNLASCRLEQGDLEAAYAILGELIQEHSAVHPHVRDARWVRSLILLQMENFSKGWPAFEHRWHSSRSVAKPKLMLPEYQGEPLAGKRIMIYGEQGIGDEIMFASCLSELLDQAGQATLICSQRLESIFRRSFPRIHVSGLPTHGKLKPTAGVGKFDFQLAAGTVPQFTRSCRMAFNAAQPFLKADLEQSETFRERLARLPGKLKVGVAWRGGRDDQDRRLRSMPLATWGPILRSRGVDFVDLQYDSTLEERREIEERFGISLKHFEEVNPLGSLDAQAALIAALDLVVSVSNASVHLAGALGVETWALLPAHWGWRWHRQREQSLFYPSVKLRRQCHEADWAGLAAVTGAKLRERISSQSQSPIPPVEQRPKRTGPNYLRLPGSAGTRTGKS